MDHIVDVNEVLTTPTGERFSVAKPGKDWAYEVCAGDVLILRCAGQEIGRGVVQSMRWASTGTMANPLIAEMHIAAKSRGLQGEAAVQAVADHMRETYPVDDENEVYSIAEAQMI